jgi:ATP-binding protein involved in chromosome partitioning
MARAEDIFDVLRQVRFPGLGKNIVELGYVKEVGLEGDRRVIVLDIMTSDPEMAAQIESEARLQLNRAGFAYELKVTGPNRERAPERPRTEDLLPGVRFKLAVASGKGGVGKSTIAVNLALALKELGLRVGLLDADIYGPSLPTMLGVPLQAPQRVGEKIAAVEAMGLRTMSLGFLAAGTAPVIWRGPLAARAIEQLLADVDWTGVDCLVLDLPPGTGDIQISLAQKGNLSGAIIVTTPQDVALIDAIKGVRMFQNEHVNVPVLGIVENMSGFVCPHCGEVSEIFPRGQLHHEIARLGVPILVRVPIDPAVAGGSDEGNPIVIAAPESAAAQALRELAGAVAARIPAPAGA